MYEKIKSWISNNRFLVGMGVGAVLFLPATCSAEPAYMITESELATLEQNSTRQLEISRKLALELQIAREQQTLSDQASSEAKLQINQLQKQLTELEAWSKKQEELQQKILKSCHRPRQGFCGRSEPRLILITMLQVSATE